MLNFMDLLYELIDAPVGRKLSERANKLLPEGLRDEGEQGQQPDPAQLQAKLQQAGEQFQQLQQAFEEAKKQLETKSLEMESKERRDYFLRQLLVAQACGGRTLVTDKRLIEVTSPPLTCPVSSDH